MYPGTVVRWNDNKKSKSSKTNISIAKTSNTKRSRNKGR